MVMQDVKTKTPFQISGTLFSNVNNIHPMILEDQKI